MSDVPRMIGLKQASQETGLSYNCLRQMCLRGEIAHIRAGSKFLVNSEKLAEHLNASGIIHQGERDE